MAIFSVPGQSSATKIESIAGRHGQCTSDRAQGFLLFARYLNESISKRRTRQKRWDKFRVTDPADRMKFCTMVSR
jgi:hypothetical protein